MESWLHIGSLNMTILISWSPEVGGPMGPSVYSLLAHLGPEPLSAWDPVGDSGQNHSLFVVREAVGKLPLLTADSSSSAGRGLR